ncbi:MAG: helix-turn-helix domain-containing protein [Rubrivivax sp.]|nr:helix-turn-helix domain-containing protein [Rubrivivax sp.]
MGPRAARKDDDTDELPLTPLGEFMQRRNAELGLSVAAVAQRVGMSRATWYRISRGESSSPGVRVLRGLARVYKVRATELFTLAAYSEPAPAASRAHTSSHAPEAGDALWRCRHDRQVRAGSALDVGLELLNLSDHPWLGAEVRGLHDDWLPLRDAGPRPSHLAGVRRGQLPWRTALPPTGPGEWALARLTLQAPPAAGEWVVCLALCSAPSTPHAGTGTGTGAGAFVFIETR